MQSTHTGNLNVPQLPAAATEAHLFPALKNTSLVSIGKFCDAGCVAVFNQNTVTVKLNNDTILQGPRDPNTGLWKLPLSTKHQANAVTLPSKAPAMVKFSHATLFSPPLSTLQHALNKQWVTGFPGLTPSNFKKHPPTSTAMHKGHLDQSRANQQSTKPNQKGSTNKNNKNKPQEQPPPLDDTQPTPLPKHNRTHACYAAVIDFKPTGQTYSDQTGKFPVTSSSGNAYLFILYDYDSNAILAEPIKNRSAESILEAYKICHARLSKAGLKPKLHRLDNECSRILKEYMTEEAQVDYQIVPPGVHRRNAAERAIRTFKNHLIAGLCSTHPDFPMKLWDRLIPQAEITLNLLRGSRMNPKLSAYAQIHGPFDCN